jgi:hypothetical protein
MCSKLTDFTSKTPPLIESDGKKKEKNHTKEHKMSVNEPIIMVARPDQVTDAQVYLYLHSQFLFSILTLKLTELEASESHNCDQVKDLHSTCLNLILLMISKACSNKQISQSTSSDLSNRVKLYANFNQENLVGLLGSAIKTNKAIFKLNGSSAENFSLDLSRIQEKLTSAKLNDDEQYCPDKINVYQLIKFVLALLNKNNDFQFDDTVYVMFINLIKYLILESEPDRVDQIVKEYLTSLENDAMSNLVSAKSQHTEYTLELMLNWIDEFIQLNQLGIAASYFGIITELNQNQKWKTKVENFLEQILMNISESVSSNSCSAQLKLINFFYAINYAPNSILSGFWIEYKNESRYDGAGILKSNLDYKLAMAKLISPDQYPNQFYISVLDPDSRKTSYLKSQKYGCDFRKPDKIGKLGLELNDRLILKLIQILKKIFINYKEKLDDLNNAIGSLQLNETTTNLPSKQLQLNYESMHINRKKEFNKVFQRLPLNSNLLVLCIVTLIKDYVQNKSDELSKTSPLESSESDLMRENEIGLIDYELLNLISRLAFLNSNMNANWKVEHLRYFLTFLLVTEGFNNLKGSQESDEPNVESTLQQENSTQSSQASLNKTENASSNNNLKKSQQILDYSSKTTINILKLYLDSSSTSKKSANQKDSELSIDDLKLNLTTNAVLGVCDASSHLFSSDELINPTIQESSRLNDMTNERRNKQSLKLLQDCIEKLAKFEISSTTKPSSAWMNEESPKYAVGKSTNLNKQASSSASVSKATPKIQPMRNAIKLVSNAATVLSCRELLILFINWTLKKMENKQKENKNKLLTKNFSIIQLNCETEFEFLQLLDVLYYTDDSYKYKLFIKNLIYGLISNDAAQENGDTESNSLVPAKSQITHLQSKILIRISMMACNFMLPEFKLLKKINWSSEDDQENDAGKLKNKTNSELLNEESINFTANYLSKQTTDIENGTNLTSKPNDIEKLSTNDSTLLIVFDTNRPQNTLNSILLNSATSNSMTNPKTKKSKLNKFLKATSSSSNINKNFLLQKYLKTDDFETVKNEENATELDANSSDKEDNESLDSLNYCGAINDKSTSNLANANANKQCKSMSKKGDECKKDDSSDEEADDDDEDDDDKSEYQTVSSKNKLKKLKESGKKCSLQFQVMLKKKDTTQNYVSNEDDMTDNPDDNEDDEDEEDEDNDDSYSSSTEDEENHNMAESDNDESDWHVVNNNNYGDSDDEKYKKSTYKLPLDFIENNPYLAINNQKMLKWKFIRRDESDWTTDVCSFKIYSTFSKNFESAYYLLDELISQLDFNQYSALNELWGSLIKIACVQSFGKRLKILSLLIKIMHRINIDNGAKMCINLYALKPLKSLQYSLESSNKEDRNLCRALFELFFFAEKLAIKWSVQKEYRAQMKDKDEFVEYICEASYFINLIMNTLNLNDNIADLRSKSKP